MSRRAYYMSVIQVDIMQVIVWSHFITAQDAKNWYVLLTFMFWLVASKMCIVGGVIKCALFHLTDMYWNSKNSCRVLVGGSCIS